MGAASEGPIAGMISEVKMRLGLWERRRSLGRDRVLNDNGIKMCDRLRTHTRPVLALCKFQNPLN